jgi:hypothetical protein
VVELIAMARKAVLAATGIELVPEVRLVGTFAPALPTELESHHVLPFNANTAVPPVRP